MSFQNVEQMKPFKHKYMIFLLVLVCALVRNEGKEHENKGFCDMMLMNISAIHICIVNGNKGYNGDKNIGLSVRKVNTKITRMHLIPRKHLITQGMVNNSSCH